MLEIALFYAKLIGIPILVYVLLRILYKYISKLELIKKVKIALNLIFVFISLSFFLGFADFPYISLLRKINYFCVGFGILYIILRLLEIVFVEQLLVQERKVNVPVFLRDTIRLLLLVIVIMILFKTIFGIELGAIIVTSTVISAVIGLAMQDTLANVISGIAMQLDRPFKVGDWVLINGREGKVVEMSWRTTKIITRDNDFIITPNTSIAKQEIFNFYVPTRIHRTSISIGASYSDQPFKVKNSLMTILKNTRSVLNSPEPRIHVVKYNDFSIDYDVKFWIDDYLKEPLIKDEVMSKIWYQFKRDGISIPFPIRDVNLFKEEGRIEKRKASQDRLLDEIVESIHDIDILQPFTREQLYELTKKLNHAIYGEGEILVRQGEKGCSFFIIKSGVVEVLIKTASGKEKSIGEFGEDYYFGEMALLTGEERSATVIAKEETEALIIDKTIFGSILKETPEVAKSLSLILQERKEELQNLKIRQTEIAAEKEKERVRESQKLLNKIQNFFGL